MREIKFRGKTTLTDKWVYGCLTRYSETLSYITEDLIEQKIYDVKTETVGQYTGLKDKNDKEIYEGDIVRLPAYLNNYTEYAVCKWIDNTNSVEDVIGFAFEDTKGKRVRNDEWEDYEIIGNIYENPELLGDD